MRVRLARLLVQRLRRATAGGGCPSAAAVEVCHAPSTCCVLNHKFPGARCRVGLVRSQGSLAGGNRGGDEVWCRRIGYPFATVLFFLLRSFHVDASVVYFP